MKKGRFFLRAAVLLLLVMFFPLWGTVGQLWADQVTAEQARQQAQAFLNSRIAAGGGPRHAPGTTPQLMQERLANGLYVFNVSNDGGFVIVSNDDRTVPVLGFGDNGNIDPANMPDNMRAWLQGYADEIAWLNEYTAATPGAAKAPRRTPAKAKTAVAPLLTTTWNQGPPYNNRTPYYGISGGNYVYSTDQTLTNVTWHHCATGCVATAMAQVMNYHKWPQNYLPAIPGYTWGNYNSTISGLPQIEFSWDYMSNTYSSSATGNSANYVALLMQYCGWSVEMNYGPSSGSNTDKVANALENIFGYNSTTTLVQRSYYSYDNWVDLMYNEVAQGRPVVYGGQSSGGGHEFVCDGYKYENGTDFFHINWGWGGMSDNYFVLSALDPDQQGIGGSSSTDGYHYGQDAVIGIQKPTDTGTVLNVHVNTIDLSINGVTVSDDRRVGQEVTVTIDLKNNSEDAYDGDFYMFIYYKQGDSWAYWGDISNNFFIPANSSSTEIDIPFTPDRTGTYCVQLFYPAETPPQIYSVGGKQPSFIIVDAKAPTCLAVSEIEATSAVLSWTDNNNANSWQVAYKTADDDNFTTTVATANPYTLTGLEPETEYTVMVSPSGGTQYWSEQVFFTTEQLAPAPTDLNVDEVSHNSAVAYWSGKAEIYDLRYGLVPDGFISTTAEWLKYDDGTAKTAFGSSSESEWTWGVMYPGTMVTGNLLSKVSFYETSNNTGDITLNIYSGGDDAPGTLLYTEVITPEKKGFHEVTFATPVQITRGNNLWITLTETGTYVLVSCSSTEPNNQWIKIGDSWYNAGQVGINGYGWMIRGYIESEGLNPDLVEWINVSSYTEKSYKMTNLIPEKDYVVQVRGDYGTNGKSDWVTQLFTTGKIIELVDDGAANSDILEEYDRQTVCIALTGRTLYKDGAWNTLCLPFDVTLADSPLSGATAKTLTDATMNNTHVTLTFGEAVDVLEAGVPYIIKWNGGDDLTENDLVFDGVTINETVEPITLDGGNVMFIGYYDAMTINTPANDDIYYMTAANTLKHTGKQRTLKACRAYFKFSNEAVSGSRRIVLDFGDETTGIHELVAPNSQLSAPNSPWYTIDGRRIEGAPTQKGLYINGNKKIIVK